MRGNRKRCPALAREDIARFGDVEGVQRRIGEDAGGGEVGRTAVDIDRRPELGDPALVQRRRVAAKQERLRRFGGRIDEDRAGLSEDLRQFLTQFLAQLVIEVGKRLVHQHEAGILDERACKRRALLLAAGQVERRAVEIGSQLQKLGRLAHLAVDGGSALARNAHRRSDVFINRQCRIVDELLVDHGDIALLHRHAGDIGAVEMDGASGRAVEPGHQPHQRRLARQRRPEQDVQRAALEDQIGRIDVIVRAHHLGGVSQFQHSDSRASTQRGPHAAYPAIAGMAAMYSSSD